MKILQKPDRQSLGKIELIKEEIKGFISLLALFTPSNRVRRRKVIVKRNAAMTEEIGVCFCFCTLPSLSDRPFMR